MAFPDFTRLEVKRDRSLSVTFPATFKTCYQVCRY